MAHRRRGVGVGRHGNAKYLQKKADEIKAVSLQSAIDNLERLELKLTSFAKAHKTEIQKDPVFRHRFLQMCAPLGVDPLASQKTILGNLLNIGDFYHELAVKVAEVCLATKSSNGGMISITEIQHTLQSRKTKLGMAQQATTVSVADLLVAVQKLGKLGGGFRTIQLNETSTMVISVPTELDNDHMEVLRVAQEQEFGLTLSHVQAATKWNLERTRRAMELLLQEGMAWLDEYHGESYYWFVSLWQERNEEQS